MVSYELKEQVLAYVESRITLEELEEWYVPRMPEYLNDLNSDDANIVTAIELGMAEFDDNLRTEDELRNYLKEELDKYQTVSSRWYSSEGPETYPTASSSSRTLMNEVVIAAL